MNKVLLLLLMSLIPCCGLSAMETKMKKSKMAMDLDPLPATALIVQLKEDIPTEVGNEIGQYIIARSGVVPFISQKIAPVCTSPEDAPQESWTPKLSKKDLVVLRPGKVVTILSGKTGNRIQTVPEVSTEECEQRLLAGRQFISAEGGYKTAKLSQAGDKMVTVSRFVTEMSRAPESNEIAPVGQVSRFHGSLFAKLWCMRTGTCLHTLFGHALDVNSARFDRSGLKVITASDDGTAKIWDVLTGACLQTLTGHEAAVRDARFNRAGDKAATGCADGTAKVWDVETGDCLATLVLDDPVNEDPVTNVKFSRNDDKLVTVTSGDDVTVWCLERMEYLFCNNLSDESGFPGSLVAISFSKDSNTMLAYAGGNTRTDHTAFLYSFGNDAWTSLKHPNKDLSFAAFNEAGDKVITAGTQGTVKIWSTQTHTCISTFQCPVGAVRFAAFDKKDKRIATHCYDDLFSIKVWSLMTGNCLYEMKGEIDTDHGSPFLSQRDALITTRYPNQISLWDFSCFQRMSKRLTLEQAFLLKALYEVAFLRKLIENRLNRGIAVLDNAGNPVRSAYGIVYDFEKNPDFLKAYTELDEPLKKVMSLSKWY